MHKVKHPMFWFCTNGKLPCVSCAEIKVDTGHVNTDIALKTWGWFLSQEYNHAGIVEHGPTVWSSYSGLPNGCFDKKVHHKLQPLGSLIF